jgi:hypothetical protein
MKFNNLLDKLMVKYADEFELAPPSSEGPETVRYPNLKPPPPKTIPDMSSSHKEVAVLLINALERHHLYDKLTTSYFLGLVEQGYPLKEVLEQVKKKLDEVQKNLTEGKKIFREWSALIK